MKNNYTVLERNRIVEEHTGCVKTVIKENRDAIRRARMDIEDVSQELYLRLILAVETYDTSEGELRSYIMDALRDEMNNCFAPARLYGITGAPNDLGADSFLPFSAVDWSLSAVA